MDTLSQDLSRAIDENLASKGPNQRRVAIGDGVSRQADAHRETIQQHMRQILAIESDRDLVVRSLQAEIEEAERAYFAETGRLMRLIEEKKTHAAKRVAIRLQLKRASEAALTILEPNKATRDAPMQDRHVPRPDVPIATHTGINHP